LVNLGDRVTAGQAVAELDMSDVDTQVAKARASLGQREAELLRLEASARYARVSAARAVELAAGGLVARREADSASEQAATLDGKASEMQRAVRAGRAEMRRLEGVSRATYVRAPIDGTITRRFAQAGAPVHGGAGATALLEIATVDPLSAAIVIPPGYASSVGVGAPVEVTVLQHPGRVFAGRLTRIAPARDRGGATTDAAVTVPNDSRELLAGMDCEVALALESPPRVARIPARALVVDTRGSHVVTVGLRGHAHFVTVRAGRRLGGDVEIVDGLMAGDRVVAAPADDVTDGMRVQPVSPESL
jgi:RND family efflux transporter MFP subunit